MRKLVSLYQIAWNSVCSNSIVMKDVQRARFLDPTHITSTDFIREYTWTVLNTGIRMQVIRKKWPAMEQVFQYWDVHAICQNEVSVKRQALRILNNKKKIGAVFTVADLICRDGWARWKAQILHDMAKTKVGNFYPSNESLAYVRKLPWMGPTNSRYLMKNVGFDLAKDDRHLRRLAGQYGYPISATGVQSFVEDIGQYVSERVSVVETVLWNACEAGAI